MLQKPGNCHRYKIQYNHS